MRTYGSVSHLRSRGRGMWIADESVTRLGVVHKTAQTGNENARTWRAFPDPRRRRTRWLEYQRISRFEQTAGQEAIYTLHSKRPG